MLIEQYYKWKNRLSTTEIWHEKIEFFKTDPTDEQIEILDRYLTRRANYSLIGALILFFLGLGLGLWYAVMSLIY